MSEQQNLAHKKSGCVINIQHYSVHDGPGIRTVVFLKGCPLRCKWCSNPESQQSNPELAYNGNRCIGTLECALCVKVCPHGAVKVKSDHKVFLDRSLCQGCLYCVEMCPAKALSVYGRSMETAQVLQEIEADQMFYSRSGGGLTLSGGEPLWQIDFTVALLAAAKRRRIHTAMETCGYGEWTDLERACGFLDMILIDIKSLDNTKHREYTGVSNEKILENFIRLCEQFPAMPKLVRTPVIPGFNDNEDDILAIADFVRKKPNVCYELLSYHRLGQPKYEHLGREYPMGDCQIDEEKIRFLRKIVQ